MTGLNKATVSSLVNELLEARFVRENGINSSDRGRPGIRLELNPEAGCIIGAEIGVDFISLLLVNFAVEELWRHSEAPPAGAVQETILARLIEIVSHARQEAAARGLTVLGLGLGVPGLVDVSTGTLLFAPNLHWTNVPLRQELQGRFDFPIHIDNEANLAALGESYFGAAQDADFVLHINSGVGLGGGIVLNRRVLPGATGLAGEIGHMTLDPQGPRCNCGSTGCWETYVSPASIYGRIRGAVAAGRASWLSEASGGDLSQLDIPLVVEAAQRGDEVARQALKETGYYLGVGLANLINAFNPQRVVFGGLLSPAFDFIGPALKATVQERALRWPREVAEIVVGVYGKDACMVGGVATVYHNILSQPIQRTRQLTDTRGR